MTLRRPVAVMAGAAVVLGWLAGSAVAQSGATYRARLGWVPTTGADRANVTGRGSITATLSGSTLAINGSFEGLAAPASAARLSRGVAVGARGIAIADLTITKATSGTMSGSIALSKEQVESLRAGALYVQVHSEKGVAPDGSNLWGWLMEVKNVEGKDR